ncbi:MAG: transcription antitermination factor NusB [Ruminococcaceae bacterium]|nr:transcription antitermination factor NusB [Oscillospiraceae bacterium]
MSRKQARDNAFKLLFEIPFYSYQAKERLDEYFMRAEENLTERDCAYIRQVVTTWDEHREELDARLSKGIENWTLDRLPRVAVAIMRLALCEMTYLEDVPYQVAINEAVELAKIYGDDDAPTFVNGVLAGFVPGKNKE